MSKKAFWVTTQTDAVVVERWLFHVPDDFDGTPEEAFRDYPHDGQDLTFLEQKVTNETDRRILSMQPLDGSPPPEVSG